MKWSDIRKLYLSTCGNAPAAAANAFTFLTEGYRYVSAKLNLQSSERTLDPIPLTEGQDWIPLPPGLYHVIHMEEVTTGQEISAHSSGTRGRAEKLAPGGKASPGGPPRTYSISGGKILFDTTPTVTTYTVRITAKMQVEEITEGDLGDEPDIPEQYHLAIAMSAAQACLTTHPLLAKELGPEVEARVSGVLQERLEGQPLPRQKENLDRRGRVQVPGFHMRF